MGLYPGDILQLLNANAAVVTLVDANGNQITTLSGTAPATGTIASIASSVTSVTLLAANANRKKFIIFNDSTKVLSVAFTVAAASLTNRSIMIGAGISYEGNVGDYTGIIQGIWAAANGFARITELV